MTKGISPLIATVIMVAFIISLGWIASQFIMGYTEKTKVRVETMGAIECSSARLEIERDKVSIGDIIRVPVNNYGEEDLSGLKLIVYNESGPVTLTPTVTEIPSGYTISLQVPHPGGNVSRIDVIIGECPGKFYTYDVPAGMGFKEHDCGSWINEDTILQNDITGCTDDNILYIGNSGITLDCNGHTLQGNGSVGINITRKNNVVIKNCDIKILNYYSYDGIYNDRSNYTKIIDNNISLSGDDGIMILYSNHLNITNNRINVDWNGIYCYDGDCDFSTIHKNDITVATYGIYFYEESFNNTISDNNITVINDGSTGMRLYEIKNSTIVGNNIDYNGTYSEYGINIEGDYNNISFNYVEVDFDGISMESGASNNIISYNTIIANDFGIWENGENNTYYNNEIFVNTRGIGLYGTTNIHSSFNKIYNNNITAYVDNAIDIDRWSSQSHDHNITGNRIYSAANGIRMDQGYNNTIYNNLINSSNPVQFVSTVHENYWNITKQTGTRIYSSGNYIGGNYWTNSTDNGYSDTCPDTDNNGFCDQVYDVYNDTWCEPGVNCSSNVDYLPLSDEWMLPD